MYMITSNKNNELIYQNKVVYECITIKSYHVHFCNGRTEKDMS